MTPSNPIKFLNGELSKKYPLKVLLAEDNKVNQLLIKKMLSLLGYKIDIAENGLEVLEYLEKTRPDLIIMDIQMPKMDGLEATRRIIEKYDKKVRPKIVILTANSMIGDRKKCLEIGADGYLAKPLRPQQIEKLMEYWGQRICLGKEMNSFEESSKEIPNSCLDFQTIEINQKLGDAFFSQVKKKFYEIYHSSIIEITMFSNAGNGESLFQASHKLKGACASIGAIGMRNVCMAIEQIAKDGKFENSKKLISDLKKNWLLTKLKLDSL